MAKRDLSALMGTQKPEQGKKKGGKKTTITFDADDEAEITRIQDVLRSKGIRVNESTQIIRVALRLALADKEKDTPAICRELAERWKRGG